MHGSGLRTVSLCDRLARGRKLADGRIYVRRHCGNGLGSYTKQGWQVTDGMRHRRGGREGLWRCQVWAGRHRRAFQGQV